MNLFIGEHGETILYGVVGIMMVCLICLICNGKWKNVSPTYKTEFSPSNKNFVNEAKNKYPTIESDDVIYADYKDTDFVFKDYLKAKDYSGKDISDDIRVYGSVDVFKKNIYRMKCVVRANDLSCTKYVDVVVE